MCDLKEISRRDFGALVVEVVAGSPGDWMRAVGDSALAFSVTRQCRPLALVPLNRLFGQRYAVYWKVKQS